MITTNPDIRTPRDLERVVGNELLKKGIDPSSKEYVFLRARVANLVTGNTDQLGFYAQRVVNEYNRRLADQSATAADRLAYSASASRDR